MFIKLPSTAHVVESKCRVFVVLLSSDMFVYLLLPFVYHFVPLLANPISIRHLYGEPVKIIFRQEEANGGSPHGDFWEWNAIDGGKYLPEETTPLPENTEGVGEGLSSLEISKSVELVFDPKSEAFIIPVMEASRSSQTEGDSHRNSILLLSSYTRNSLHKIFEKFEKEAKGSAITDAKNYQTGRFKLHFRKRGGF